MSEDKKLIPKRRFKEFENAGAWEQRKLGEVAPIRGGYAFKSYMFKVKGIPIIRISNILSTGNINGDFVYYDRVSEAESYILRNGSALLAMSGATTGKVAILKSHPNEIYYQNQRVGYFNRTNTVHYLFVSILVRSIRFKEQLEKVLVQGAQPNVSPKEIDSFLFSFPSKKDEQLQIGFFFDCIDNLITLHQRKLEKLKADKKAYLSEMFPAEGECKPKLRFEGFNDDWEQRKLYDTVDFFSGLTYTPSNVQKTGTLVLRSSNVRDGEVVYADNVFVDSSVVNSENVKEGDIIVVVRNGSRSLIGKHAQIKRFMPNTVIGAFMTGIRSRCPAFTNALLNTPRFEEEVAMNMGATINQITGYMFSKMEFKVPSKEEQEKIGDFFTNLDHIITLHQRRLEKLKNIKKAYLNEMFI